MVHSKIVNREATNTRSKKVGNQSLSMQPLKSETEKEKIIITLAEFWVETSVISAKMLTLDCYCLEQSTETSRANSTDPTWKHL